MSRILAFEVPPGKPILRGHDHYWSVIRDLDLGGAPWSVNDIVGRSNGAHPSSVRDYVKRLIAAGYAEAVDSIRSEDCFRLLKLQGAAPSLRRDGSGGRQGRGQIQMWNVIRGPISREGFTFKDVALYASTETVAVDQGSASRYVAHLAGAGYLHCLRKGRPRHPALWRLKPAMNTGPKPPLILRSHIVFDQNRGEALGTVEAREVAP